MVNLSREIPVTRNTPFYSSKRVIYHGKSIPCNRMTYYEKSYYSRYPQWQTSRANAC